MANREFYRPKSYGEVLEMFKLIPTINQEDRVQKDYLFRLFFMLHEIYKKHFSELNHSTSEVHAIPNQQDVFDEKNILHESFVKETFVYQNYDFIKKNDITVLDFLYYTEVFTRKISKTTIEILNAPVDTTLEHDQVHRQLLSKEAEEGLLNFGKHLNLPYESSTGIRYHKMSPEEIYHMIFHLVIQNITLTSILYEYLKQKDKKT